MLLLPFLSQGSWYWPFEIDMLGESGKPRLSELMEPATTNIDAAVDFAAEGKLKEAQDCYRAAIVALDQIEADNPERAATPEFATVRNKRAYVNAALDAMLLAEARENAKAVAVTDTTALEVKLVAKPWDEFLPTYEALTNADWLVTKRIGFVESGWARELLDAVTDPKLLVICVSNRNALAQAKSRYATRKGELEKAYRAADVAIARMEKFSESVSTPESARIFDVCRTDACKGIAACKSAWPKLGEALQDLDERLVGLRGVLLTVAAHRDFPEIAKAYADNLPERKPADATDLAKDFGELHACSMMQEELDAAGAGIVYTGCLYRIRAAWGGAEMDVPQKEEDRGLVKEGGDGRPKMESQIEAHVQKDRKRAERTKRAVVKSKMAKKVQREVKALLKANPKSRKARMLMAGEDLRNGDTATAKEKVKALLDEKPNDGPALNMRAAIEAAEGDLKAAGKTLDQAIQSNPRDYHAYYNMANVYLQMGNVDSAKRYYETGRAYAGPKDDEIEKALKK